MENPNTWTPLHHELFAAHDANSILEVLNAHDFNVTLDQVVEILALHQEQMDNHICGLSLPSLLIQKLRK